MSNQRKTATHSSWATSPSPISGTAAPTPHGSVGLPPKSPSANRKIAHGRASISATIKAPGVHSATVTYSLDPATKSLAIDWLLDKEHQTGIEAVMIAFPFNLGTPSFRADVNGVPFAPNEDQLDGTVMDWYPIGRWIDVSDGERTVTLTPLDAPLVQIGGITTGKWARKLEPEGPTIISWALHNHWMVNFKASQGGEIPQRYRLTTHAGPADDMAATRFGLESTTQPIVLRDYLPTGATTGKFLEIPENAPVTITAKPADDGDGIIIRLQNIATDPVDVPIAIHSAQPRSATLTSSLEIDDTTLPIDGSSITVHVGARDVQSVRIRFA